MLTALTHLPSPALAECQLTYVQREAIDYERALQQHASYCDLLSRCGARVTTLCVNPTLPDSTFVEDCAIVLDELAIITSMGTAARRTELAGIALEIARWRPTAQITPPAAIEGGDVLRIGRTLYVGLSGRSNAAGIDALRSIVRPYGYRIVPVVVRGCLHLKTACAALDDDTLVLNPTWLDLEPFIGFKRLAVADGEPWGANVLRVNDTLCMNAAYPDTIAAVQRLGYEVRTVDISEFAKAEGGLTCMSLLVGDIRP